MAKTGAMDVLFTCTALGLCIDSVTRRRPDMPVPKPNEAIAADAMSLRSLRTGAIRALRQRLQ